MLPNETFWDEVSKAVISEKILKSFVRFFLQAGMESYPANEDYLLKLVYQGACENTVGLPLNVQVVGRPWQEELVLHVMKLLQDNVNFH